MLKFWKSICTLFRLYADAPDTGGLVTQEPASTPVDPGLPSSTESGADAPEPSLRDQLSIEFDKEAPPAETPQQVIDRGDGRDPRGRFAPKTPAEQALEKAQPAPSQPEEIKAPPSWRPEIRGEWAKLPLPVRNEIIRREVEIDRGLRESSQARTAVQSLQQTIGPYMHNVQAGFNGDAVGMIGALLNADNILRHGTQGERAKTIAGIIRSYGVDVEALDATLAGQIVQEDPTTAMQRAIIQQMDQRYAPVLTHYQQEQERQRQQEAAMFYKAQEDVEAFSDQENHEHARDPNVRMAMADFLELNQKRGVAMSMQEAYDRALALDPRYAGEVQQRQEAARVRVAAEAAQRAHRAAVSLPSGGAPAGQPNATAGDNVRSDVMDAWERVEVR